MVISTGLVAAYTFNEGSGTTVADASGNGNSGIITNATWSTTGKYGAALSFNGSNSWVTINDSATLDLTKGMTIEAWVNPTTLGAPWRTVAIKEVTGAMSYALYANTDTGKPSGHVYIASEFDTRGVAAVATKAWTHLATTFDGATLCMYVNGALVSSKAVAGSIKTSNGVLRIGGNSVWGEYFSGLIDEVRVYNRALAASEIQSDMNTAVTISGATATAKLMSITTPGAAAGGALKTAGRGAPVSLVCSPAQIVAGGQTSCELRFPSNVAGREIQLASSNGGVKVPQSVRPRANESRVTFTATAGAAAAGQLVTVTASAGDVSAQETLAVANSAAPVVQLPGKQFARFGQTLRFHVSAADAWGLPVPPTASGVPAGASFDPAAGTFEWTPAASQAGKFEVTFSAVAAGRQSAAGRAAIDVDSGAPVLDGSAGFACSPGATAELTGKWLSDSTHELSDPSGAVLSLGGTSVKVNGVSVPVLLVAADRVRFQCPSLPAGTPLSASVATASADAAPLSATMQAASPTLFPADGSQGLVTFAGTSDLAAERTSAVTGYPAQAGDELLIWGSGFGVSPRSIEVELGGAAAEVLSVDTVQGQAGVYTVRVRVPARARAGTAAPVRVVVNAPDGTRLASNTVTVALQQPGQ
jgi:uncharacterized protein (TIGR03437 family)